MTTFVKILLAFLMLFAFQTICQAQQSLVGEWIGGYTIDGKITPIRGQLKLQDGNISGTLNVQKLSGAQEILTVTKAIDEGGQIRFEITKDNQPIIFTGNGKDGTISGEVQKQNLNGTFELLRVAPIDTKVFDKYAGSYKVGDNIIAIGRQTRTGTNARLGYVELKSGRRGNLTPLSEDVFVGGQALGFDYPIDVRITFVKNNQGEVTGLKYKHGNRTEVFASNLKLKEEEVKFQSGGNTIAGTLVLPNTKAPHPVIVLVHGSTPLARYYYGADPYLYPALGIAVLFYDKRGVYQSTGERSESIEDLAADALAGVEYLKTRREINPKKIGLHGHSQGGWVVPEAASRSKDVAFIIAGAASGRDTFRNQEYEVMNNAADASLSQAEIEQAVGLFKLGNKAILANGEGWNDWRAAIIKAKDEKWFQFARSPSSLSEMNDANRERIMTFVNRERRTFYNPVPTWEKIKIPVFVYQGEWDRDVPAKESVKIIETALKKAGNKDYAIRLFPKAQHGLWAVEKDNRFEPLAYRVHYDALFKWLLNQTKSVKN